jgi:hypothetical protein
MNLLACLRRDTERRDVLCISPKVLIDGTRASGLLMGRRLNGRWIYRRMTPEEEAEFAW